MKYKDLEKKRRNWRDYVPGILHKLGKKALKKGDVSALLVLVSDPFKISLLYNLADYFKGKGMLEKGVVDAFSGNGTSNFNETCLMHRLILSSDYDVLRESGCKIPKQSEYRLYRGVSGIEDVHGINDGYHWTRNLETACFYAARGREFGNPVFSLRWLRMSKFCTIQMSAMKTNL